MAQVVGYDIAKLPKAVSTPSKYDTEFLSQFVTLITKGKAAGDGVNYATKKEAVGGANSIKRAIRKHVDSDLSLQMRVWQGEEGFMFALTQNTRPLTGAAAAARAGSTTE